MLRNSDVQLRDGEVVDQLGYQGLKIIQDPRKFKFTIDALLLASFIKPKTTQRVIDLGSGGGVLPLLLAGQDQVQQVVGLEIQPELVDMATRSVILNQLEAQVIFYEADLRQQLPQDLRPNSFDYVISNPPYFPVDAGMVSENQALAIAKFELCCSLPDVLRAAVRLVKGNGKIALIYPSQRMEHLFGHLRQFNLSPQKVCYVHPNHTASSNLMLVEARPGKKSNLQVLPPIFVYDNNRYSPLMDQIFHGEKLENIF